MLNHIKTILITALLTILVVDGAQATMPYVFNNFHTHSTPLALEPLSSNGTKVAGVYWLPDYLEKNIDFDKRINDGGNKDKSPVSCESLGYLSNIVYPYSSCVKFLAANKIHCYKNCICDDKVKYSKDNCTEGSILGKTYEQCHNLSDSCTCPSDQYGAFSLSITKETCAAKGSDYQYSESGKVDGIACGKCCPVSKSCGSVGCKTTAPAANGCAPYCSVCNDCCKGFEVTDPSICINGWTKCTECETPKYKCNPVTCNTEAGPVENLCGQPSGNISIGGKSVFNYCRFDGASVYSSPYDLGFDCTKCSVEQDANGTRRSVNKYNCTCTMKKYPNHDKGLDHYCGGIDTICGGRIICPASKCCQSGYQYKDGGCVVASCPTGYSTETQSISNCPNTDDYKFVTSGASAGKTCGKCQQCVAGGTTKCTSVPNYSLGSPCTSEELKEYCTNCEGTKVHSGCISTIRSLCYNKACGWENTSCRDKENGSWTRHQGFDSIASEFYYRAECRYGYANSQEEIAAIDSEEQKTYKINIATEIDSYGKQGYVSNCSFKPYTSPLFVNRKCSDTDIKNTWLFDTPETIAKIRETVFGVSNDATSNNIIVAEDAETLNIYDISKDYKTYVYNVKNDETNEYYAFNKLIIDGNIDVNKALNISYMSNTKGVESSINENYPYSIKVHQGRSLGNIPKLESINLKSGGLIATLPAAKATTDALCKAEISAQLDVKIGNKAKLLTLNVPTTSLSSSSDSNKVCAAPLNISGEFDSPYTKAFIEAGKVLTPVETAIYDENGELLAYKLEFKEEYKEEETINYVHGLSIGNYSSFSSSYKDTYTYPPYIFNLSNYKNGGISISNSYAPIKINMIGDNNIITAFLMQGTGDNIHIKGSFSLNKFIKNFTIYKGEHKIYLADGIVINSNYENIFRDSNIYFSDSEASSLEIIPSGTVRQCNKDTGSCRKICTIKISNQNTSWKEQKCSCDSKDLADGYVQSGNDCVKINCPNGYKHEGNECIKISCPAGYIFDQNGSSGAKCYSCPSGQYSVADHKCINGTLCKDGTTYDQYGSAGPACYSCSDGGTYSTTEHKCIMSQSSCKGGAIYDAKGESGAACYSCSNGGTYSLTEHKCVATSNSSSGSCPADKTLCKNPFNGKSYCIPSNQNNNPCSACTFKEACDHLPQDRKCTQITVNGETCYSNCSIYKTESLVISPGGNNLSITVANDDPCQTTIQFK